MDSGRYEATIAQQEEIRLLMLKRELEQQIEDTVARSPMAREIAQEFQREISRVRAEYIKREQMILSEHQQKLQSFKVSMMSERECQAGKRDKLRRKVQSVRQTMEQLDEHFQRIQRALPCTRSSTYSLQ